jgi:hypothetical protein
VKTVNEGRRNQGDDGEGERGRSGRDILGSGATEANCSKDCNADHHPGKYADAMTQENFSYRDDPDEESLKNYDACSG